MNELRTAPVLSTQTDELFDPSEVVQTTSAMTTEELDIQYEIKRTVQDIRQRRWKRIALQFPDDMLVDSPRVYERLKNQLATDRTAAAKQHAEQFTTQSDKQVNDKQQEVESEETERLTILGDTSYGACCVDEIAAEHASADGVVHYGRSCLSPTQRLDVIYVFTSRPLDISTTVAGFQSTFPDHSSKICLLADVPWQHYIPTLLEALKTTGYNNIVAPELSHNPSSLIPNRALSPDMTEGELKEYSVFHISTPPTSLVLTLTSRIKQLHVLDVTSKASPSVEVSAPAMLRRRYASLLRLSSASVIGVLINTLSVKNYMVALEHVKKLIADAGKKSYTFVVGKVNPAKLANFAEVGGWVVIGCWESSLIDSKEFLAPVITPFELEIALMRDDSRVWGQEWISDFQTLLQRISEPTGIRSKAEQDEAWQDQSDDEPPDFDLRTGRYVSHSRPMQQRHIPSTATAEAPASSALVQRAKGDLALVNGVRSPGADFLRSKREWQGLGSDFAIEYDRDEKGNIQGASMEEGRSGVAKGYTNSHISTPS